MKLRNKLVLGFAIFLIAGVALRELYVEPYPLIVLPGGAVVYEHKADTLSSRGWAATAYVEDDSVTVPADVLFPGSPTQYQYGMFSSLSQADTSSAQWDDTGQWIRKNLSAITRAEADSLCINKIQRRVLIDSDKDKTHYKRSFCYRLQVNP